MSDEKEKIDKSIQDRLHAVFPNPQVAARVVDLVVHNRPMGWGRKSNAPYYKEMYALQLKADIDRMIESGNPICYRYSLWCNEDTNMSKNTLYTRINQSIRYLIEMLDTPDHKYGKWYESVNITREIGVGIVIKFIVGLRAGSDSFKAEEVKPRENMPVWKQQMEDWLEGDSVKPFCVENLTLSPDEVVNLTTTLANLENIQASVASDHVKIIRIG